MPSRQDRRAVRRSGLWLLTSNERLTVEIRTRSHARARRLLPSESHQPALDVKNAGVAFDRALAALPDYPGGFMGSGIVIPGGGIKYLPCAWVCIHMLRHLGCVAPIELWHLGP